MKKKKKISIRVSLLTLFGLILISSSVSAFVPNMFGYNSYVIKFSYGSTLNTLYSTAVIEAAASWNGTDTKAVVSKDDTSPNKIYGKQLDEDWYGQYTPLTLNSSNQATKFEIFINGTRIAQDAYNGVTIVYTPRSTMTHEFGHALHLDHTSVSNAVMYQYRNRELIYAPKPDDIAGVNDYWPRT